MFDKALAEGRFGNAAAITARAAAWYTCRGVPSDLSATGRFHPFIDHSAAEDRLTSQTLPAGALDALDEATVTGWASTSHPCDGLLEEEVRDRLNDQQLQWGTDTSLLIRSLADADTALCQAVPELWEQVRPFVTRVRLVDDERLAGLSWQDLSGLLLFGSAKLRDSKLAAESLLHEALHAKSARLTRSFVVPFQPTTLEFIEIPWWRKAAHRRYWGTRRLFDAFYVYAHLGAYYMARQMRFGTDETMGTERVAFRAAYLHNVLTQLPDPWLDDQRRELVGWLHERTPKPRALSSLGQSLLHVSLYSFGQAERALSTGSR